MRTSEVIEKLRAKKADLGRRGVEGLAIFGSRARGDNRDDSDLDLLLDVPRAAKFSLIDLESIERQRGDNPGFRVGAAPRRGLKPEFAQRIADDVIEVF